MVIPSFIIFVCKFQITMSGLSLRSQVIDSKQPKLGLTQEFVVLLVRMRLVLCLFELVCLFVCFTGSLDDWVL